MAAGKQKTKEEISFKPVSSDYLYHLLTSERFLLTFKSALEKVRSTHKECGYHVFKDSLSDQTQVTDLIRGGPGAINFENEKTRNSINKRFSGKNFFEFGTLHFHPLEMIANPSHSDLSQGTVLRYGNLEMKGDFPPISMIAIAYKGKVSVLVYQEPLKMILERGEVFSLLEDQLEEAETQNEVIDVLKGSGYKAMILRAHASGDFYREDVLKFADYFAFTPKYNRLNAYGSPIIKGSSRLAKYVNEEQDKKHGSTGEYL
jgi:hypothetical protein